MKRERKVNMLMKSTIHSIFSGCGQMTKRRNLDGKEID